MIKSRGIVLLFICLLTLYSLNAQVYFDDDSPYSIHSINGVATWEEAPEGWVSYNNNGTNFQRRALLYSDASYQSDDGFKITLEYTTGSIGNLGAHNFSFGLISDETDLSTYTGFNPFNTNETVYSLGVNLTADEDEAARGVNFTNGSERITLHTSGKRHQFVEGEKTKIFMEVGRGGFWSIYINDHYEESGAFVGGFDLSKSYRFAVYGQDDNGGGKSIQSIKVEKQYASGERAASSIAGTWTAGTMNPDILTDFKTIGHNTVGFNSGAIYSAQHFAPHKLLEILSESDPNSVPLWGDLTQDEPQNDETLAKILKIRSAGVRVQAYTNSDNFTGSNTAELEVTATRWKNWCDTSSEAQAFIASQPYHTGVWDGNNYVDATNEYPDRKYMFCYAEFILKDYSIRYGKYIDAWVFDSGSHIASHGDNKTSGVLEEQRIYQAWSNAVRAGNPDIATAYNNSRSTTGYYAYPYAHPVNFEDFAFAHAFGGNNNHAEKVNGNQYNLNYQHVERIIETDGHVFDGGGWEWASQIVGNFNSKVSTTAWNFGTAQAWEEEDFLSWNLEGLQNGGSMMWSGSVYRWDHSLMQPWAYNLFKALDDHLCKNLNPGPPNWARAYTILADATIGVPYSHTLIEGEDFWDPEGDDITAVNILSGAPSWLTITESPANSGNWVLSGTPTESSPMLYEMQFEAVDDTGLKGTRKANLQVNEAEPLCPNTNYIPTKIEAEDFCMMSGIQTEESSEGTMNVGYISDGDWLLFNNVNLTDMKSIKTRVAGKTSGSTIEVRTGGVAGALIATIPVSNTGGWQTWTTDSVNIDNVTGMQHVYLVFKGVSGNLFNINWFGFSEEENLVTALEDGFTSNQVSLFPNPANNSFTISGTENGRYELFDNSGIVHISGNITSENNTVNSEEMLSGVYFVKVVTNGVTTVEKIVFK